MLHVPKINKSISVKSELSYLFLTSPALFSMVFHYLPVHSPQYDYNLRKKKKEYRLIATSMCYLIGFLVAVPGQVCSIF